MNDDALRALLPQGKHEVEKARTLVALGYPAVTPVLPNLMEWLQDGNWPVAHVMGPFLAGIGLPLAGEVRRVFATDDVIWKYWCIVLVVAESPALLAVLRDDLAHLAAEPPRDEDDAWVAGAAQAVLRRAGPVE